MAKAIDRIQVTNTFQNWFDKTNEIVDLIQINVVTASATGDLTVGDANLQGDFRANTVVADTLLEFDTASSFTSGSTINFDSPIQVNGTSSQTVSTFNYSTGPQIEFTDGTISWDIGFEDSSTRNFIINTGIGDNTFELSTAGKLTVPNLVVKEDIEVLGEFKGDVTANNVTVDSALTAGSISSDDITGNFNGDLYHANTAGGDGSGKIMDNGGPAANQPATFWGNVSGTVSSLTNHTTDSLGEGTSNLYFKKERVRDSLTAGLGVGIIADPDDTTKTLIAIGQNVATTASVTFNNITLQQDLGNNQFNQRISLNGSTGDIVAEGDITAFGSVSDITRKENIEPIENALDKVSKLGGYTFNYIDRPEDKMTGVIAQELLEVLPEAVYKTTDRDGHDIYAVRHGNIVGLLIEAIKELKAQIDSK